MKTYQEASKFHEELEKLKFEEVMYMRPEAGYGHLQIFKNGDKRVAIEKHDEGYRVWIMAQEKEENPVDGLIEILKSL